MSYIGVDHSNDGRIDRKRAQYSKERVSNLEMAGDERETHGHGICQRAIHISQKEISELYGV